ncbi:MAG: PilZ domain-containing protein [Nitrospira sp.]|nr:PilZ domain-containing protein [Nitrospira sp.]
MRCNKLRSNRVLRPQTTPCNRREHARIPVEFSIMYSAQPEGGNVLVGDGTVTSLSRQGLGIRGNRSVRIGMELALFLYLPDGQDPLFVTAARVAWTAGHRFGVIITGMNVREQNRLRYFVAGQHRQERDH